MRQYKKQEESLHKAVCNFLKLQFPDLIFTSESGGIRLTMGQAVKAKSLRSESKLPDLLVMEPRGGYSGLFIEIKKESVWLRDGSLSKDKHVQAQGKVLDRLKNKGYYAVFGCGIDGTMSIINTYMKLPANAEHFSVDDLRQLAPKPSDMVNEWWK